MTNFVLTVRVGKRPADRWRRFGYYRIDHAGIQAEDGARVQRERAVYRRLDV